MNSFVLLNRFNVHIIFKNTPFFPCLIKRTFKKLSLNLPLTTNRPTHFRVFINLLLLQIFFTQEEKQWQENTNETLKPTIQFPTNSLFPLQHQKLLKGHSHAILVHFKNQKFVFTSMNAHK